MYAVPQRDCRHDAPDEGTSQTRENNVRMHRHRDPPNDSSDCCANATPKKHLTERHATQQEPTEQRCADGTEWSTKVHSGPPAQKQCTADGRRLSYRQAEREGDCSGQNTG